MPLTLNVGLTKKVGLPNYGSLGASCHVEVELPAELLTHDLDGFHGHVRRAFVACRQAVQEELSRQTSDSPARANGHSHHDHDVHGSALKNGNSTSGRLRDNTRRATANQVRAIGAIADRQQVDLDTLLRERFKIASTSELSITEASELIDELKTAGRMGV